MSARTMTAEERLRLRLTLLHPLDLTPEERRIRTARTFLSFPPGVVSAPRVKSREELDMDRLAMHGPDYGNSDLAPQVWPGR